MCRSQPITHTSMPRSRQKPCRRSWCSSGLTSSSHFVSARQWYPFGKLQIRSGSPRIPPTCFSQAPPTSLIRSFSRLSTVFSRAIGLLLLLTDHRTLDGAAEYFRSLHPRLRLLHVNERAAPQAPLRHVAPVDRVHRDLRAVHRHQLCLGGESLRHRERCLDLCLHLVLRLLHALPLVSLVQAVDQHRQLDRFEPRQLTDAEGGAYHAVPGPLNDERR